MEKASRLDKYKEILEKIGALSEVEQAEEYIEMAKPLLELGVDVIFELTPQLRRLCRALVDTSVDMRIRAIKRYQEKGDFSKEEAMILALTRLSH